MEVSLPLCLGGRRVLFACEQAGSGHEQDSPHRIAACHLRWLLRGGS
jgi:hypothetical protein